MKTRRLLGATCMVLATWALVPRVSRAAGNLALAGALGCSGPQASSPPADASDASIDDGASQDATGCGFTCSDVVEDVSVAFQVQSDLIRVCGQVAECHGSAYGGLALSADANFSRIIDVEAGEMPNMVYVEPYYPIASYLFLKVRCEGGIDGGCMPLNSPTEQWRVDLYHAWIEAGAPTQ